MLKANLIKGGDIENAILRYDGIKQTILKDLLLSVENKESISEKIRLFYVALTRAKEKMIFITIMNLVLKSIYQLVLNIKEELRNF